MSFSANHSSRLRQGFCAQTFEEEKFASKALENPKDRYTIGTFKSKNPEDSNEVPNGFLSDVNRDSLTVLHNVLIDRSIANSKLYDRFQFERVGYFCVDRDTVPGKTGAQILPRYSFLVKTNAAILTPEQWKTKRSESTKNKEILTGQQAGCPFIAIEQAVTLCKFQTENAIKCDGPGIVYLEWEDYKLIQWDKARKVAEQISAACTQFSPTAHCRAAAAAGFRELQLGLEEIVHLKCPIR
ncbi:hypothetical protein TELCIR_04565 [Teladorsagia circumcincta]|uniref:tRNA synthetases class I (E and Q) anti-codon binding domain-containing protein n=1 Tax=Teladorsagia circumcincta TaxID=45464 RepID=A0A2G9UTJ4_TELCI|nr:hypothetical protein TELCIR_04565 [Teladorsagia circumcincta]